MNYCERCEKKLEEDRKTCPICRGPVTQRPDDEGGDNSTLTTSNLKL